MLIHKSLILSILSVAIQRAIIPVIGLSPNPPWFIETIKHIRLGTWMCCDAHPRLLQDTVSVSVDWLFETANDNLTILPAVDVFLRVSF